MLAAAPKCWLFTHLTRKTRNYRAPKKREQLRQLVDNLVRGILAKPKRSSRLAMTVRPARLPAVMPGTESSTQQQRFAAAQQIQRMQVDVGSGLLSLNCSPLTTYSKASDSHTR